MHIFGMGPVEIIIIVVIILLIFGPKQLPKLGKAIGRSVKGLRSGVKEAQEELHADEGAPAEKAAEAPALTEATETAAPEAPAAAAEAPAATETTHVKRKVVKRVVTKTEE